MDARIGVLSVARFVRMVTPVELVCSIRVVHCEGQLRRRLPRDLRPQRMRYATARDVPGWWNDQRHSIGSKAVCVWRSSRGNYNRDQVLTHPQPRAPPPLNLKLKSSLAHLTITRTRTLGSPVRPCQFLIGRESALKCKRVIPDPAGPTATPNFDLWIIITPNGGEMKIVAGSLEPHRTTPPNKTSQLTFRSYRRSPSEPEFFVTTTSMPSDTVV